jgi:hypothetical protein
MILVFFVPAIVVSVGLLVSQLVSRRHEVLTIRPQRNDPPLATALLREQ